MADQIEVERRVEKALKKLPGPIGEIAKHALYNPRDPQYRLKKLKPNKRLRKGSWRINVLNQDFRAIAEHAGEKWNWYFFGTHEEYNNIVGK